MACVRQHLDAVSAPCKDALMKLRAARRAAKG
jgi:hypothetical protein